MLKKRGRNHSSRSMSRHIHMYVSMVGNNKTVVKRYVENQMKEDMMSDQITIKEYKDPFKG